MLNYRIDGSPFVYIIFQASSGQAENWTKTKDFHLSWNLIFLSESVVVANWIQTIYLLDIRDGLDSVGDGGHLVPDRSDPGARTGHQEAGIPGRQEADNQASHSAPPGLNVTLPTKNLYLLYFPYLSLPAGRGFWSFGVVPSVPPLHLWPDGVNTPMRYLCNSIIQLNKSCALSCYNPLSFTFS